MPANSRESLIEKNVRELGGWHNLSFSLAVSARHHRFTISPFARKIYRNRAVCYFWLFLVRPGVCILQTVTCTFLFTTKPSTRSIARGRTGFSRRELRKALQEAINNFALADRQAGRQAAGYGWLVGHAGSRIPRGHCTVPKASLRAEIWPM